MKHLNVILTIVILPTLFFVGCATKKDLVLDRPPPELYAIAQKKLYAGNFSTAAKYLEALDARYPFSPYTQQVQLDLIYAYYKTADFPLAQATVDRFIKLNPTHMDIPYVLYMSGLTNMALDNSSLQNLFGVDRSSRDTQYTQQAFRDFIQLVRHYPDSIYSADATQRLIFLKNNLAKHELAIAQYYMKRGAYIAVVNRVDQMLQDYPDTQSTRKALPLMEKSYRELGLLSLANSAKKLVNDNPVNEKNKH